MRYQERTVTIMICILFELPTDMDTETPEGRRSVFLFISVSFTSTADWYIGAKSVKPHLLNERINVLIIQSEKTLC